MGLIETTSGWWEFEGEEPPGLFFTRSDEGGDADTVRALLRVVDGGVRTTDDPLCEVGDARALR